MNQALINQNTEVENFSKRDLTKYSSNVKCDLPKYWDRDYINQKIQQIKNHNHKLLMQLLWMTGVRISEAISITKGDLDFKNYTVMIKWLKRRKMNYRHIPLHPALRDVLDFYTASMNNPDKLFDFSRVRAYQICKQHMNGNPHMFRHSFAVNLLKSGGRIETLCNMLGHSDIKVTMIYLQIVPTDIGKELIKIDF